MSGSGQVSHQDLLTPSTLSLTDSHVTCLVVGQCIFQAWADILTQEFDRVAIKTEFFNYATELNEIDLSDIDFQVLSVPLRTVMPEGMYMRTEYADVSAYQRMFEDSCGRIDFALKSIMKYNVESGLLTFVANFFTPIANPMGRLLPRYDLRNPVYFIEELNRHLARRVAEYDSAYILDLNQVSNAVGKRYVQDDAVCALSHNAIMANHAVHWDAQRLEPPVCSNRELCGTDERGFVIAAWNEVMAMHRTVRGADAVKMVVMDLDDTLWRGIAGDAGGVDQMEQVEGWPLGIAEALTFLKKRGIILAISSKNEESYIREIWPYEGRLSLDDFSFVRINWKPKAENILEMIRIANILPSSVLFVDDNPVERQAVLSAIPGIRVIGSNPYLVRSTLLWASEIQLPFITEESGRRTEMMQAQEARELDRSSMSRSEFLAQQNITIAVSRTEIDSPQFQRAFELLNKTNQFNTNGKRWDDAEIRAANARGMQIFTFKVADRFTDYGLVGVLLVSGNHIDQFVMSCRVQGMDVEIAALSILTNAMFASEGTDFLTTADIVETSKNFPCRDVYERAGYSLSNGRWLKHITGPLMAPAHINVQ